VNCPKCDAPLDVTGHAGVEIKQCTTCEGMWIESEKFNAVVSNKIAKFDLNEGFVPKRKRKRHLDHHEWHDDNRRHRRKKNHYRRTIKDMADMLD